jgi:hypothetical protein
MAALYRKAVWICLPNYPQDDELVLGDGVVCRLFIKANTHHFVKIKIPPT